MTSALLKLANSFVENDTRVLCLKGLLNKVVEEDLQCIIRKMVDTDPRLLCRLNLRNAAVSEIVKGYIKNGDIDPLDLMYSPEETFQMKPRKQPAKAEEEFIWTEEDEIWFQKALAWRQAEMDALTDDSEIKSLTDSQIGELIHV